uniref:Putative secreted protein n=1 Tax=Anopheles darlingi TaxID=43151 RepID=A0A2M4DA44_ANODA
MLLEHGLLLAGLQTQALGRTSQYAHSAGYDASASAGLKVNLLFVPFLCDFFSHISHTSHSEINVVDARPPPLPFVKSH